MKPGIKPLRWFTQQFGHRTVDVFLTTCSLTPLLGKFWGRTEEGLDGRVSIYIDASTDRAVQDVTALHELMHMCLWDAEHDDDKEEKVVGQLDHLFPVLALHGLQWPPRPRGAKALEKWARK